MRRINVLAIFANPRGSDPLRLGAEERVIRECIALSKYRDFIFLETKHAATIHDLRRALLMGSYQIIHFSGHGTGKGLAFEDEQGQVRLIAPEALAELLATYSPPIECVILNACYSDITAQITMSLGVPYTIAMQGPISDNAAIEFTRGFYDAIGAGRSIEFAYQEGCRTLKLLGFLSETPIFFKKAGLSLLPAEGKPPKRSKKQKTRPTRKPDLRVVGGWSYPYRPIPWGQIEGNAFLDARLIITGSSLPVEDLIEKLKDSIKSYFCSIGYRVARESRTLLQLKRGSEWAMIFSSDIRNVPSNITLTFSYDYPKERVLVKLEGQTDTKGYVISNLEELYSEFERFIAELQIDIASGLIN